MRASQPIARSSIHSVDSQTRAIARTATMMPSAPKPVRIALCSFEPASLGGKIGLFLQVGAHPSGRAARSAW
eukprot:6195897-Pleurochrysis_carterae.AAC.1